MRADGYRGNRPAVAAVRVAAQGHADPAVADGKLREGQARRASGS